MDGISGLIRTNSELVFDVILVRWSLEGDGRRLAPSEVKNRKRWRTERWLANDHRRPRVQSLRLSKGRDLS